VEGHIRIDGKFGPLIAPGTAHLMIAFDMLEGLRYARDNQEEALKILLKHKPELEPVLTERQIEVLQRAARGQSNRDIGAALGVTERTVKDHMTLIFQRLDVASRAQAGARAGALGLIRRDAPAVRAEGFGA
jgi:DNA-binding NarL/FixJ family response regulator